MMTLQNKNLHYQISNWNQITKCKSNNSKDLYLSLVNLIGSWKIEGLLIQVNHAEFGTLFAAMIEGTGKLITDNDERGYPIPFMTTEQILAQLAKFGFYIVYDVKSNLPDETFNFLKQVMLLGYDKITKVILQTTNKEGEEVWLPTIVVFKSTRDNKDLWSYGYKLSRAEYIKKIDKNSILNVTQEDGIKWDWVTSYFNISDIIDENIDIFPSSNPIVTDPNVIYSDVTSGDTNFSVYTDPEINVEESDNES